MSFRRRTFLQGLGAAIALPFLESMAPRRARGAAAAPRRFVTWFSACGTIPENFHCSGDIEILRRAGAEDDPMQDLLVGQRRSYQLSPILAPLERHKQDMLVLEGMALAGHGYAHWQSTPHQLTGHRYAEGAPTAETAAVRSLDQELGDRLASQTRFGSLQLGVMMPGESDHSGSVLSYRGPNEPVYPRNDPFQTFADMFGDLPAGDNGEALARRLRRKTSILDSVLENGRSLQQKLGAADRIRLDRHLEAIRNIERQLTSVATCSAPAQGQSFDFMANDNAPLVGALHMDLLAVALACDLTRVASLQWAPCGGGGRVHSWLAEPAARAGDWHGVSHDPNNLTAGITAIQTWYSEQLALFVDKLKSYDEGAGTLLDSTTVWSTNEYGNPDHTHGDMPFMLIGSCGGAIKTGRCLVFNNTFHEDRRTYHTGLLAAVNQAMGGGDEFGDAAYGNKPLPELLTVT